MMMMLMIVMVMMMVIVVMMMILNGADDNFAQFHLPDKFVLLFHQLCLHILGPTSLSVLIMILTILTILTILVMIKIMIKIIVILIGIMIMDGFTYGSCLYWPALHSLCCNRNVTETKRM